MIPFSPARGDDGRADTEDDTPGRSMFLMGQALGRIEHKVDDALAQQTRIESQQTHIFDQHNRFDDEVKRLASELVELRARVQRVEDTPPAPPAFRAPLASTTSEILGRTHESLRVMAAKQETLDAKQDEQMVLLRALTKSPRMQLAIWIAGGVLFSALTAWQASRPPVVITAPAAPAAAPAVPLPPRAP